MSTVAGVIRGFAGGAVHRRRTQRNKLVAVLAGILACLALVVGGEVWAFAATVEEPPESLLAGFAAASPSTTASTSTTSTTIASIAMSQADLKQAATAWAASLAADPQLSTCQLAIPSLDLDLPVLEMTKDSLLDLGPGHWPETPLPGLNGHFVISGHRSTHGSPFLRLGELEPGDSIVVTLPYAEVTYKVTRTLIVGWEDVEVVRSRGLEELSLTTCHPIGRADSVMVVQAEALECRLIDN